MFKKCTEQARGVIIRVWEEAQQHHEYLGPEHLLLGMLQEGGGMAVTVLQQAGWRIDQIRMEVERHLPHKANALSVGEISWTPQAKKVLEYSSEEARLLGHYYIGTGHLLLGLLKAKETIAAKVLQALGIHLDETRGKICDLLRDHYNAGKLLQERAEYAGALTHYTQAVEHQPQLEAVWFDKDFGHTNLTEYKEALWFDKGLCHTNLTEYKEALDCFANVVKINTHNACSWYQMGYVLVMTGEYGQAVKCCTQALALVPTYIEALETKAEALHCLGQYADAVKAYVQFIAQAPSDYTKRVQKLVAKLSPQLPPSQEKAKDAEALYLETVWFDKGLQHASLAEYKDALDCFSIVVHINKNNARTWHQMGYILIIMGEYAPAVACCAQALALAPTYVEALETKAEALHLRGYDADAFKACLQLIEQTPTNRVHKAKETAREIVKKHPYVLSSYRLEWSTIMTKLFPELSARIARVAWMFPKPSETITAGRLAELCLDPSATIARRDPWREAKRPSRDPAQLS